MLIQYCFLSIAIIIKKGISKSLQFPFIHPYRSFIDKRTFNYQIIFLIRNFPSQKGNSLYIHPPKSYKTKNSITKTHYSTTKANVEMHHHECTHMHKVHYT